MNIWTYHPETGELSSANPRKAQEIWNRRHLEADDPRRYAIPANATTIAPPAEQEGYTRCFIDGAWTQVEDHTGETVYGTATGAPRKLAKLGPLPDDVTTDAQPSPFHKWDAKKRAWTEDAARKAEHDREVLRTEARAAARERIVRAAAAEVSAADIAIMLGLREPPVIPTELS